MLIKLLVERTGRPILSTLVISSRSIITKPNSDPYSDPYHGKTGQHALTALKTMKSQTLCAAALCGIRRHQMTRFKIAHRRFESFTRCQMENLGTAMVPRFFFVLKGLQFPHFPRSSKYTIKNQQNSPNLNWTAAAFSSIITSSFYRRRPVWKMRSRKKS